MGFFFANLLHFARLLRRAGLDVQAGRMLDLVRALEHIDIGSRQDFYHALRCLLVHRPQDLAMFDDVFRAFWRQRSGERTPQRLGALGEEIRFGPPEVELPSLAAEDDSGTAQTNELATLAQVEIRTFSSREVLRETDFARLTADELAEAELLMAQLRWDQGERRTRRWLAGDGPRIDLRRLQRVNARYGGEWPCLPKRRRKFRRRKLVLICDVSGSMERYTRMLLLFSHCLTGGLEGVESFLFATRLTRITRHLKRRKIDEVLAVLPSRVPDWSGGTNIGAALRAFNLHWTRRLLAHSPVVLLISDGWDRGEPELLRQEIARLQRSCHRLVWLNPLLGAPDYEPLTRGMQAALPFVDDFLPVHNLSSLEALAKHLNQLPERRPQLRQAALSSTVPLSDPG